MASAGVTHSFNDDLLANDGDIQRARKLYPDIMHVLDDQELRQIFRSYDDPANVAKRRSRNAGFRAVAFVTISLLILALEPVLRQYAEIDETSKPILTSIGHWLVYASAAFAVLGAFFGLGGLLFRQAKNEWLHRRLMTERLRMLHFQTFVCRIPEIAASLRDGSAAREFVEQRKTWLAQFALRHEGKLIAELDTILEGEEREKFWLHPEPSRDPANAEQAPANLFAAYRELRIVHQLQYATFKLGDSDTLIPSLPRTQAEVFSRLSMLAVLLIVALHVAIGLAVFLHWGDLVTTWLASMVVMIAVLALAIRTLEEGLKPEREIERYQHYQSSIRSIRDRFDAATTARERVLAMEDMERLVFDEMCDFMETHAKARFVM